MMFTYRHDFNIEDSATYKLIHEMDSGGGQKQTTPSHQDPKYFESPTYRIKQEESGDYPHHQGFVNPYVQSPSFKKIQLSTIGSNMADGEIVGTINHACMRC